MFFTNTRRLVSPKMSAYIRQSNNTYLEKYLKTSPETNGSLLANQMIPYNPNMGNLLVFPIAFCLFYFLQKRGK